MSSNLAMLDCWLLCLKAQLVKNLSDLIFLPKIIQNFHKRCLVSHLTLFLLGEFRTSSKSGVWKFDNGHHELGYVETFADMKTPSWPSLKYIEQSPVDVRSCRRCFCAGWPPCFPPQAPDNVVHQHHLRRELHIHHHYHKTSVCQLRWYLLVNPNVVAIISFSTYIQSPTSAILFSPQVVSPGRHHLWLPCPPRSLVPGTLNRTPSSPASYQMEMVRISMEISNSP